MTTPFDYDVDPERFRLASRVTWQHLLAERSLYERLAELLVEIGARRVLDVGCGEGALRAALPARLRLVGLDPSWTMLGAHPRSVVQASASALPFPAGVFDAVVAVNLLDPRGRRRPVAWPTAGFSMAGEGGRCADVQGRSGTGSTGGRRCRGRQRHWASSSSTPTWRRARSRWRSRPPRRSPIRPATCSARTWRRCSTTRSGRPCWRPWSLTSSSRPSSST